MNKTDNTSKKPTTAMVLAAGIGKRMRPVTATIPKPLVEVGGKALIDYGIDALVRTGVGRIVVNVHYLPDLVRAHMRKRQDIDVVISDETDTLLESGGGIAKALPELGDAPFYVINSDTFWVEGYRDNLDLMAQMWDDSRMDVLLLIADMKRATGYEGRGDFVMDAEGGLTRVDERDMSPFIYAGAAIVHPRAFAGMPVERYSLNRIFDQAIDAGRLFGVRLDGLWLTVGTPQAIRAAERVLLASAA